MMQRLGEMAGGHEKLQQAYDTLCALPHPPRTPSLATHVFSSLVSSHVSLGDVAGAQALCREAMNVPMLADNATPHFLLGTLSIFTGSLPEAEHHFAESLKVSGISSFVSCWCRVARLEWVVVRALSVAVY